MKKSRIAKTKAKPKKALRKVAKPAPRSRGAGSANRARSSRRPTRSKAAVGKGALAGVRILDMSHIQAGPSATQIMAWLGADVIKVEMPGRGDITRGQLRDLPNVDSLYFTMLNCNKRSITINMKSDHGKAIFTALLKKADVLIENFGPGVMDRQGFPWETIRKINPRVVYASIKGFGPGPYADCKAYENVAQCMGGSASTTGWETGPPTITGAQIGDSGTGIHCIVGILAALIHRERTGRGQRVELAMQDCVLNLTRVKMRDQQRLAHGPLREYPNKSFGEAVPRAGNASGGGQPGNALRCKGNGPNDYIYVIIQPQVWAPLMNLIGRPELIQDERYATPEARLPRLDEVWAIVEAWTQTQTKFEAMTKLNDADVPCGPIMSMKDLIEDESLVSRDIMVDVPHPTRGSFKTIGCPIKLSDSPVEVKASPLLGEHTDDILTGELGYTKEEIQALRAEGAI
ncbi:MAG: formyl-CoA transferase [Rhodospirillales bacterium]|nr:formyl-CoA transferase [Rhodospirillales bacterium]